MSRVISREQYETLADLIDVDRDLELTDADIDADGDGHVSEDEFHGVFDDAIDFVYTAQNPDSQTFDEGDLEDFKTNLAYNQFCQWGRFFAENSAESLTLRENLLPDAENIVTSSGEEENHSFTGATENAGITTVTRGGENVPVYAPEANIALPIDEIGIAEHLQTLDADVLPLVQTITLNPTTRADIPDAYMDAGATGNITVYPHEQPPLYAGLSLHHEVGHVWSFGRWTSDPSSPHWDSWKASVGHDGGSLRDYAETSIFEDFSDFFSLFFFFRNDPHPNEQTVTQMRELFPPLFQTIDATGNPNLFEALAESRPNRFAFMQEIADHELSGPFSLGSAQWRDIQSGYTAAYDALNLRDFNACIHACEGIIAVDQSQNEAKRLIAFSLQALGTDRWNAGDIHGAATYYEKSLKFGPDQDRVKLSLYSLYDLFAADAKAKDDWLGAAMQYERALALNPNHLGYKAELADAYVQYAVECEADGLTGRALGYYEKAYGIDPDNPLLRAEQIRIHAKRGETALRAGNDGEALEHYEKILGLDPSRAEIAELAIGCHRRLAAAALEGGRDAEAKAHYEAILKLDPNDQEASDYVNGITRVFGYALPF